MRILRIQLENLSRLLPSLIGLEHGSLAEAGIYGLVCLAGETSIIFDALSLVLYGQSFHTEQGQMGEKIRGRGESSVEVLFETPKGRYIVRWQRSQNPVRTLFEEGGAMLSEVDEEITQLVTELGAMDCDQFRRSVENAQDDLARFFAAKPAERPQTLENPLGSATMKGIRDAVQFAIQQQNAVLDAVEVALSKAELSEVEAKQRVEQAEEALAKLLRGRTADAIAAAEKEKLSQREAKLMALRMAIEKRDNAATEAARLADTEASLVDEIEAADQEKIAMLMEKEAQLAVLEAARVEFEKREHSTGSDEEMSETSEREKARRNLKAAQMAYETAAQEATVAADFLTRMQEELVEVKRQRGELRRQQAEVHEAFEKAARAVRVFTPESLAEAFDDLEKASVSAEQHLRELQEAQSALQGANSALHCAQQELAEIREEIVRSRETLEKLRQVTL